MKEFLATMAGVILGAFLFTMILGPGNTTKSLKSETGNVMKYTVKQMHEELVP
ncbi:hypothetical protein [Clostridium sp. BNL1100]|uniref:hypothetical protein n=1 Tax=Clostridium sp. BNL1100 TaxID=755731 RepID=UPI00024A77D5|nr:hypothetical protein [Clostridium sp. BNL1100]AEY65626.1 hypothetical protein Clo1100_1391 [Clostridium sp. BNL1100]